MGNTSKIHFYYHERRWSNFTTANQKDIKTDKPLNFSSTHATLYPTRPFPCISEIVDLTPVEQSLHGALFTGNLMLY